MGPWFCSKGPIPCRHTFSASPTWKWGQSLQKDEKRVLDLYLNKKYMKLELKYGSWLTTYARRLVSTYVGTKHAYAWIGLCMHKA